MQCIEAKNLCLYRIWAVERYEKIFIVTYFYALFLLNKQRKQ